MYGQQFVVSLRKLDQDYPGRMEMTPGNRSPTTMVETTSLNWSKNQLVVS